MTAETSGREIEIQTVGERSIADSFADLQSDLIAARGELQEIRETMIRTEEMVQKFIAAVRPVVDDLIPTVVALSEHPMLRTFLGGKKKNK